MKERPEKLEITFYLVMGGRVQEPHEFDDMEYVVLAKDIQALLNCATVPQKEDA